MKKYFYALFLSTQIFSGNLEPWALEPLVVGTTTGYAPFVSLDVEGRYEGFDIDFAEALSKKLNRKLVIKDCGSMPSLLLALKQKKIDLLIWAVSITPERLQKMEMIYYQGEKVTQMPILFWDKIPEGISSFADLQSKIVSVEAGSYQEEVLKKTPNIQLKQVEKITDAVMEIRFGKSNAALVDPSLILELTNQYPKLKVLRVDLKPEDYCLGNGICINRSNQLLIAEVKKAVEALAKEGKVLDLEKKWKMRE